MTVTHIVSFRFKDSVPEQDRQKVHSDFLQLKTTCKRASGESYIVELIGGKENTSPEGAGKSFEHSYVVTFADAADRDWYVDKDAAHDTFKKHVKTLVSDAFIFDFDH